ncbi:MAG: diaminopimelate decarboxylase, partial [Cellulomonadaceae bacterium]|nr:diaminopimelate decarboxylase [Cellulomonadaceae bacterium]
PGALLGLHGNNKSDDEIGLALDEGFGQIIVDSLGEIDRVADLAAVRGVIAPVLLRLVTGVHAGGHEYISTAHEDQKFGLSVTPPRDGGDSPAMEALLRILARPSLRLLGLHSHIGSQILEVEGFAVAARAVLQLRSDLAGRTGYLMEEVDLGGGYGIAYLPGEPTLDPRQVATSIAAAVGHTCADLGTPVPRISIEPGRSIVGPAGMTLYTVGAVKPVTVAGEASQSGDGATGDDGAEPFQRLYVAVDGGMSDNIRPALYQAVYHAELANRVSSAPLVRARIVGKHCESGDILIHDIDLPSDIGAGDLIAIAATGAYGRSMASNYNLLARPPVIAVRDGETRVLLRRETVADLLALDEG